ncbi:CVNH domain-containing protein [Antarctobacter sp.]|uniref:CVNH domain-containing protein n=1 Tax=Antarctobacter sp. TaxID=1872577 RepID=UPI002B2658CB|nr:CVNH domain-containing protein [Antarctobacter sp.]
MKIFVATAFLALASTSAFAGSHSGASTFQNTCSNIAFQYGADGSAQIAAVCLKANGMPNQTSIAMPPIGNNNGMLEMGGNAATFQMSCGSITLEAEVDGVTLYANCRTSSGEFMETSIPVPGINNSDGTLTN